MHARGYTAPMPTPAPLQLLYQDEHLIAVDKPPGLAVHRSRLVGSDADYLIDRLRAQVGGELYLATGCERATSSTPLVARSSRCARYSSPPTCARSRSIR